IGRIKTPSLPSSSSRSIKTALESSWTRRADRSPLGPTSALRVPGSSFADVTTGLGSRVASTRSHWSELMSVRRHSSSVRAGNGVFSQYAHASARRRARNSGSPALLENSAISARVKAPTRSESRVRGGARVSDGFTLASPLVGAATMRGGRSADRSLHLELDQAVHLDRVLHGKLLRDRHDKPVHDHRRGFRLGNPAAHQIEDLLVADLRN